MKHEQRKRERGFVNMNPVSRLIPYSDTPQCTGLEYSELRDLRRSNGSKTEYYKALVENRMQNDYERRMHS